MTEQHSGGTDRRAFLTTGAALAVGGLTFGDWTPALGADATLPKRKLGRTGLEVTTLAFGTIQLRDNQHVKVLEHAIDAGINYVHTCPGYQGGHAMAVVGEVMKTKRDKVYLALKTDPRDVDRCLKVLNTDHVDVLIPDNGNFSDEVKAGYDKAKAAGKIRFTGFACHNGMAQRMASAIDAKWLDVNLVKYNEGCRGEIDPVMERAVKEQKMGFMAMKVRHPNFAAGIRSLLSNPNLTCVTPGMGNIEQVDQNIAALTQKNARTRWEDHEHAHWVASCAGKLCSMCGKCDHVCPQQIALTDYLRAELYRERGDLTLARDLVHSIPRRHSVAACTNCGHCNHICHKGVDVVGVMQGVARV